MQPKIDKSLWMVRRKRTFLIYCLLTFLIGLDGTMMTGTVLAYLKNFVEHQHNTNLYYTLLYVAYFLSSILFSAILSPIVDRKRNTRVMFSICILLASIGNVIYTLPYHPWLLISGRFLAGVAHSMEPMIVAEIARSYNNEQTISKLGMLPIINQFGVICGPVLNTLFTNVDFSISDSYRINFANAQGIFLASVWLIAIIIVLLFMSDLSAQFDLKAHLEIRKDPIKNRTKNPVKSTSDDDATMQSKESQITDGEKENTIWKVLFHLMLKDMDVLLILITSFFLSFCLTNTEMWLPLVAMQTMKLSTLELNIIIGAYVLISMIIWLVISCAKPSNKQLLYMLYINKMTLTCILVELLVIFHYPTTYRSVTASILCTLFGIYLATEGYVDGPFLAGNLAEILPSYCQTFAQSVRANSKKLGDLAGIMSSVLIYNHIVVSAAVLIFFNFATIVAFARRKTSFV